MRLFAVIFILCLGFGLASCRKDLSGLQPLLVQDIIIDSNTCEIYFTYDNQNRLTSIIQCDTTETFTYSHDTVIDMKTAGGSLAYKNVYLLNAQGLATSYTLTRQDGSMAYYTLTYDAQGNRLVALDKTDPGTEDSCFIVNGDVLSEVSTSSINASANYSVMSTYYANTINTLSNVNYGLTFLGVSSANFKKTDSYTTPFAQYTVNYTYVLNYQNGVQSQVSTINGVVIDSRSFDYY